MKKTDIAKIVRQRASGSTQTIAAKLQVGDIIDLRDEGPHLVWFVNESRAACIPTNPPVREYVTAEGKKVRFQASGNPLNISPNSDCPIIDRTGVRGALKFLS